MRNLVLLLIIVSFMGCDDSDEKQYVHYTFGVNFSIVNSIGEDLLNPEHPNHFDENKIKVLYLVEGELQSPNNGKYTVKGFNIVKHENEFRIYISPNPSNSVEKLITYIQWNDYDTDTLEIKSDGPYIYSQRKVWFNKKLVWDSSGGVQPYDTPYFILEK